MKKILFLLTAIFLIFGCGEKKEEKSSQQKLDPRKPMSWGHQQTIYVFADENVWKYAKSHLQKNLERFHFTTTNEKIFEIKRAKNIEQFYRFNNLLFFCDLEATTEISEYVKDIISKKIITEVKENSVGIYPKNNLWANDQFVLFLLGDNERNLLTLNIEMANEVYSLFREKLLERISRQVYQTKIYSQQEFADLSWKLKLPKSYVRYKKDENFLSYLARLRNKPDRYISVYWEDIDEKDFGKDWFHKKRADLAWKYYDEDEFDKKDAKSEKIKFLGQTAWKLSGRWQNKKYAVGGAFQSFSFYDKKTQKAYLIDNSVYFPEGDKLPALLELEIISKTFSIKSFEER